MSLLTLRRTQPAALSAFDPRSYGDPWAGFWAGSPDNSPPADGGDVTSTQFRAFWSETWHPAAPSAQAPEFWTAFGGEAPIYRASVASANNQPGIETSLTSMLRWDSTGPPTSAGQGTVVVVAAPRAASDSGRATGRYTGNNAWELRQTGGNVDFFNGDPVTGPTVGADEPVLLVGTPIDVENARRTRFNGTFYDGNPGNRGWGVDPTIGGSRTNQYGNWTMFFYAWYPNYILDEPWFGEYETGLLDLYGIGGSGFNPETDINWHSLWWTEGTQFSALGLGDGAAGESWPNETGESSAAQGTAGKQPAYAAALAALNGKPAMTFGTDHAMATPAFTTAPDYSNGLSVVTVLDSSTPSSPTARNFMDGLAEGNRLAVWRTNDEILAYAGDTRSSVNGLFTTGPHMCRVLIGRPAVTDSTFVDEQVGRMQDLGTQQLTGVTLGARYTQGANEGFGGSLALHGLFEGDITTHINWPAMKAWITSHYGITLA